MCVFYPRADLADQQTTDALRAAGADVTDVVAYENELPNGALARLVAELPVESTLLMSGSAAERVARAVPLDGRSALGHIIAIGPSTAKVAHVHGLPVHDVADPHTAQGVLEALTRRFPYALS
jgi:uroporphyrinogen-III synthase